VIVVSTAAIRASKSQSDLEVMHIALYGVVGELESRLLSLTARQNPFNTDYSKRR
jgi:hypothetical protein